VEEKCPMISLLSGIWVRNSGSPIWKQWMAVRRKEFRSEEGEYSTSRGDMAVSPDGRYLAYIDSYLDDTGNRTKSRILRIINSSGHALPMNYWIVDWQWLIGWTDNQHLAIFTGSKEILILDPFTGRWEKLPPPAWLGKIAYDYYGNDGPFYSPSLNRILVKPDDSVFELKDFQTGEVIYEGNGSLNGGHLIGQRMVLHWLLDQANY
jgi:hypothetical protein